MPFQIRAGTAADIPLVLPLVAKTIALHERLDSARFGAIPDAAAGYEGWLRRIAGSGDGLFLVALNSERIAGFLIGAINEEYRMYRVRRYGFMHDLWVEEDQRRAGAGRALVLAGIERFRELGAEQVRLDTASGNEAAQRLFAACGFRPATIELLIEL